MQISPPYIIEVDTICHEHLTAFVHFDCARANLIYARSMKVAPSCAIALTTFEAVRHVLAQKEWL